MAFSQSLVDRIRHTLGKRRGLTDKRMFGGVAFLLHGNMLVGVWQASLIARVGVDQAAQWSDEPDVRPFDVAGRPMRGWLMIDPDGVDSDQQLALWIERAWTFVSKLPPK